MISCYVIGELCTVEALCIYINDYPLTELKGYAVQQPEHFDAVYVTRPDVVFVDVAFLGINNSWLERIKQFSAVVLVSENAEMAFEAFEYAAFDYLTRPITFNRFVKSINKFDHLTQLVQKGYNPKKQHFVDSFFIRIDAKETKEVLIKFDQLIYIEAMQNDVVLHMENNQHFSCRHSMKEMEDNLPNFCFSRIHKSFIINDEKITAIEGNMVILNGNEKHKLLVGNTYRKTFFEKKAQKMFRRKSEMQIFSYPKLASALVVFGSFLLNACDMAELNLIF